MSNYKDSLNLPRTKFPMRASLTKNEPLMLDFWERTNVYERMISINENADSFVLHDGPPYANGHIHLGTAMNKILKDIIVKSQNFQGKKAEYVPGWDCHGLPIELKVEQELKEKRGSLSILDFRQQCRKYALKFLDIQREEFKRLGVFGTWDDPYLTMKPVYEAATARELGNFMSKGSVHRSKKPIHWCCSCKTALAEAEVEYDDHTSPSIYVRFPLLDEKIKKLDDSLVPEKTYIVIWTTTPWTIPDNMAVAVHPEFEYVLVQVGESYYILAKYLLEANKERFGWEQVTELATFPGTELEGMVSRHPFYNRPSPIVLADYVTLDVGTGCVHTAPGHGQEDYETGLKNNLEILSPLDDTGTFLKSVEYFGGMNVFDANPKVVETIKDHGNLLAVEKITHSYPHCWRCKKPVIFRATTQWFISMDTNDLRGKALEEIDHKVHWIPSWGRERIHNMIENRPDWCISRQRMWGVPIVALVCKDCDQAYFDGEWVHSVVNRFESHENGADYWFEASVDEIKPDGLTCPGCGSTDFAKEDDILDVWFDSGTSFAAVVEKREECRFPADLYLEGTDQHRGWFHSSLLASVGTRGQAPYKTVLTHGFVVDGHGKKMSKSLGNVVAPQEIIDQYGAEILRIWVSAENYQEDMRISKEILTRLVDAYRRIRNTCRFLLGNLADFDPDNDSVPFEAMLSFDRYALHRVQQTHVKIRDAYNNYSFHKVFHTLHNLCRTELSSFYLDIIKDRLYVMKQDSLERRSAQTAIWNILLLLLQDMAPVLSFTAEEVFRYLPEHITDKISSVFCLRHDIDSTTFVSEEERELWDLVALVREEVTKVIEPVRKSKEVGHSLDTKITLYAGDNMYGELNRVRDMLREIFIVSQVELLPLEKADDHAQKAEEMQNLQIKVEHAQGEKCQRCWTYSQQLGQNPEYGDICPRCTNVMTS